MVDARVFWPLLKVIYSLSFYIIVDEEDWDVVDDDDDEASGPAVSAKTSTVSHCYYTTTLNMFSTHVQYSLKYQLNRHADLNLIRSATVRH